MNNWKNNANNNSFNNINNNKFLVYKKTKLKPIILN
jgi:hypothetical protein